MTTLARYIVRLYLVNVFTLLVVLSFFIVTVDVIVNLDKFSEQAANHIAAQGGEPSPLWQLQLTISGVIDIWGPRLLQLFVYLNGLVLVAGMGFTCSQLVQHRELVAMLASGISLRRAARPFLVVAITMMTIQAGLQEFAIPRIAHLLPRDQSDVGKRKLDEFPVRLAADGDGRLWYAAAFNDAQGLLRHLTVWERSSDGVLQRVITADSARWTDQGWVLEQGVSRLVAKSIDGPRSSPIHLLATDLDPTQLKVRYLEGFAQNLSSRQLTAMIHGGALDNRARARIDRIRWGRLGSVLCSFFTLIAVLPIFMRRLPQPMISSCLRAAPIGLSGFAASAASASLSIPGLPAWLGALVPASIMLSLAIALYSGLRT